MLDNKEQEYLNRYAYLDCGGIKFSKFDKEEFKITWQNKVMIDKNWNSTIILVKTVTTNDDLEKINIGDIFDLELKFAIKNTINNKLDIRYNKYKLMYFVKELRIHTGDTLIDTVRIFTDNKDDLDGIDSIITREENQQLRNTMYKLRPNNVTYNVNCDFNDLNTNAEKFIEEISKITERQIKYR